MISVRVSRVRDLVSIHIRSDVVVLMPTSLVDRENVDLIVGNVMQQAGETLFGGQKALARKPLLEKIRACRKPHLRLLKGGSS